MRPLVSTPEFARLQGISEQRVRQLLKECRIPGARKIGRNWVIPEDARPAPVAAAGMRHLPATAAREWLEREGLPALVRAVRPERVVLFGSHGRGRATRNSDLDLCVILESKEDFFRRSVRVQGALPPGPFPVDVVAYTPAEMEANRDLPFFRSILQQGVTVYERRAKP